MNVQCRVCKTSHVVNKNNLPLNKAIYKFTCKKCKSQAFFTTEDRGNIWYVLIKKQQVGPINVIQLAEYFTNKEINETL